MTAQSLDPDFLFRVISVYTFTVTSNQAQLRLVGSSGVIFVRHVDWLESGEYFEIYHTCRYRTCYFNFACCSLGWFGWRLPSTHHGITSAVGSMVDSCQLGSALPKDPGSSSSSEDETTA
jgi:hypothetical protein